MRVCFRRPASIDPPRRPRVEADGGELSDVVVSPDLRGIAALWRAGRGELRGIFPAAGRAAYRAGDPASDETVTYVLLDERGARVTMTLPRACPLRPAAPLRVHLDPDAFPARLRVGATTFDVAGSDATATVPLPRDGQGPVLVAGDLRCVLETASGRTFVFLLGVDPDGVPTASSGYVETGPQG